MSATTTVAAFDFDGTLTKRDTVVPFLRLVAGSPALFVGLVRQSHRVLRAAAMRDRDRLRTLATQLVFTGRTMAEVERLAEQHADTIHGTWLRTDTVARLAWHQEQGHRIVVVSASYEPYVRFVADRLGVGDVLATQLEVDEDGYCTGRLLGPNCRGPEKIRRLTDWLARHDATLADVTLWAYGDSAGDHDLLAVADHPHLLQGALGNV